MGLELTSGRLRGELTEFVGRRTELALIRQALGTARLVTLTGPGGIGKTRLAIEAAAGARRTRRETARPDSGVTCPPPVKIRGCLRVFPDAAPAAGRHCR
jgi:hypothetical protein